VGPAGDRRLLSPHNKPVQTQDGWISFTINTDPQVRAFLAAIERDDLLDDARFSSVAARARNVTQWFELRGAPLTGRTTSQWLEIFKAADIACQPCNTIEALPQDPHLSAVGLVQFEDHPTEGKVAAIRSSIRVNETQLELRAPASPRGWETREILNEQGFSATDIEELFRSGAALEYAMI
jgi:crotonobetainyl-CoA:carnitine CoA-transferase CaiB-like acyl-CoA transferase